MSRVAILQSNYIPWVGYFELMNSVDIFVIYDEVQYTKRDWRNRNLIKTDNGKLWLTIPCKVKGEYFQSISDVRVSSQDWRKKHWHSLVNYYRKSKFFDSYKDIFQQIYYQNNHELLTEINISFINEIKNILGIKTKLINSSEIPKKLEPYKNPTTRLMEICKALNAISYTSGPAAKKYFDIDLAKSNKIDLIWFEYKKYEEYKQVYQPFIKNLSIVDLIFNIGNDAKKYVNTA